MLATAVAQVYAARAVLLRRVATVPYTWLGLLRLTSRVLEPIELGVAIAVGVGVCTALAAGDEVGTAVLVVLALRWLASTVRLFAVSSPLAWGALLAAAVRLRPNNRARRH